MADQEFATVQDGAVANRIAHLVCFDSDGAAFGRRLSSRCSSICHRPFHHHAVRPDDGGSFNPLSVAFAVLFIGWAWIRIHSASATLGTLQGRRFKVRWPRRPRFRGAAVAGPMATARILSFLPTDYKGCSELGEIAASACWSPSSAALGVPASEISQPSAKKSRSAYAFWRRSITSRKASRHHHHRYAAGRRPPSRRLPISSNSTSIDQSAQSQGGIHLDFSPSEERPQHRAKATTC